MTRAGADADAVASVVRGYLRAVAARDFDAACSHLAAPVRRDLVSFARERVRADGRAGRDAAAPAGVDTDPSGRDEARDPGADAPVPARDGTTEPREHAAEEAPEPTCAEALELMLAGASWPLMRESLRVVRVTDVTVEGDRATARVEGATEAPRLRRIEDGWKISRLAM